MPPLSWYVARVKTPNEQRLANYLTGAGVETLCPIIRRRKYPPVTAFPGYLFTRLDLSVNARNRVFRADTPSCGFMGLISFGGQPAVVGEDVIEGLRREMRIWEEGGATAGQFKPGDRVQIAEGPFAHWHGVFQRESSAERVMVLLEIFGANRMVEMSLTDLRRV